MKIIVFSDTHGINYGMREVMTLHPNAECYLHLGDGAPDFINLCKSMGVPHAAVRGNCDFAEGAYQIPLELTLNFGGFTFYLTHGHLQQVKFSTLSLRYRGMEEGADVILFGHTHEPMLEYVSDETHPYYLMNPGSLGHSYGSQPTYGVIEIKGKNILLSHGKM